MSGVEEAAVRILKQHQWTEGAQECECYVDPASGSDLAMAEHQVAVLVAAGLLREDPAPVADVDPLAGVKVGDDDPTADRGVYDPDCPSGWEGEGTWGCTREPGHPGQHIAGDGDAVCAVLPAGGSS